jgi:2-C-methyl-D-erythritol 2,4-cyclodiphosphate synthase
VRVGQGFDAHRLVEGRRLVLGGVEIAHSRGLAGHSDGDVLLHAIANALLGAMGEGDLGRHFPSSDAALRDIASGEILARVASRLAAGGFEVANIDATVVAEEPRLGPHREKMESVIAGVLGVEVARVNVKVTSTDGLGFAGRGEGIAAFAVVALAAAEGGG